MMDIIEKRIVATSGETRLLKLPKWDTFDPQTILPEVDALLAEGRALIARVAANPNPSFAGLVTAFEEFFERLSLVTGPADHLDAVLKKKYPELEAINEQVRAKVTQFRSELSRNEELYRSHVRFRNSAEYETLPETDRYLIDRSINDFELAGVALPAEQKERLKEIEVELVSATTAFRNNIVASSDAWTRIVADEALLRGIPDDDKKRMRDAAIARGKEGWLLTLQQPDVAAITTYADDRGLRAEVTRAYLVRASELCDGGANDNAPHIAKILALSSKQAEILGRANYAELSLEKKMAKSAGVDGVRAFLNELVALAKPKALEEYEAMKTFAKAELGLETLEPWDFAYVSEKMLQKLFGVNEEEVRQYLPFSKAMEGLSSLLEKIYGVRIIEVPGVSTWHEEVRFFELRDGSGDIRGGFYADMYAREGKQPGAWVDALLLPRAAKDGRVIPVAYLNCNAQRPENGAEAYLKHDDLVTLFHEAGHVMHHLLGDVDRSDLSMFNVEWDAIELPSQIMENWCWEKEMLRLVAKHRDSGLPIPKDLLDRLIGTKFFNTGLSTLRQLSFGIFDWDLYSRDSRSDPVEVGRLWQEIASSVDVRPTLPESRFPNSFGHIFSGGYAAGYFSYMWALGLAADAFEAFREAGDIFSREVGTKFLREVLAVGSSRPMADSFRAFRGRDLDPKTLAVHLGLVRSS